MNKSIFEITYKIAVSVFVSFVLLFQAIISLGPVVGIEIGTRFWPILNYAMYSGSFREGDTVNVYKLLEGVTEDGTTIDISMDTLGMSLWHYRDLVRDLESGRDEAIQLVLNSVAPKSPLVEIRIKSFPMAVTRDGPREQPSEIQIGRAHV